MTIIERITKTRAEFEMWMSISSAANALYLGPSSFAEFEQYIDGITIITRIPLRAPRQMVFHGMRVYCCFERYHDEVAVGREWPDPALFLKGNAKGETSQSLS